MHYYVADRHRLHKDALPAADSISLFWTLLLCTLFLFFSHKEIGLRLVYPQQSATGSVIFFSHIFV